MAIDRNLLKEDPDIARLLHKNQSFEEQLDRALRVIAVRTQDFDQAKMACLKAFEAIVDGIKVFFSFVGSDSRFAFALLDALNKADTSQRLCRRPPFPYMFHRSESRAIGEVYTQQILDALRRTHWMFVIVPSDDAVSTFVDFEIGAFSVNQTLADKLICIHHPAVPQKELTKQFDQVKTTKADLSRMFEKLFSNADAVPGIPRLWDAEAPVRAKLIDSLVSKAATLRPKNARAVMLQFGVHLRADATAKDASPPIYLHEDSAPYVHLRDDPMEQEVAPSIQGIMTGDLDSTLVSGTDSLAGIFGWTSMPHTFGELTSKLQRKYPDSVQNWKTILRRQIADIEQGTIPSGNDISFQDFLGRRRFRSGIISFTQREDPREVLSILIGLEEAIIYPSNRAPLALEVLETAMRLSYRFRWEVLEAFQGPLNVSDIETIENRLVAAEQELRYRGVAGSERIFDLFDSPAREEILDMQQEWLRYRSGDGKSGILDVIFFEKNQAGAEKLERVLPVMKEMNAKFMLLAAPKFAELVSKVWGEGT